MHIQLILQPDDPGPTYEDLVQIKETLEELGYYINDIPTVVRLANPQPPQ